MLALYYEKMNVFDTMIDQYYLFQNQLDKEFLMMVDLMQLKLFLD
jgi:hypothetical protein